MEGHDPGNGERRHRPRHSGPATAAARFIRRLIVLAALGCAAFLAAGMAYGDPRFAGVLNFRIGSGDPPAASRQDDSGGVDSGQDQSGRDPAGQAGQPGQRTQSAGAETGVAGGFGRTGGAPPSGFEEAATPLGAPEPPPKPSDSYKFLAVNSDGSPVGYSPCRPLHYVVNARLAPEGAAGLVPLAIQTISRATGIQFVDDGATDEEPSDQRTPYQPGAYGDRWAPLLISWTTPDAAQKLGGKVIGTGGSTHYSYGNGPKSYVTGSLELDAPQMAMELERPDGTAYATAVILHELGHVMGLEHVDDPVQLMYPEIGAPDGLAAGDLNGLYQLGRAPCRKDL
ncbi:matrixin family metalloprotease [Arthrobacter sp. ISL-65]|uniref:matrixin family metalloprotease n=1 Tax=Arthrobacter sp. ISL-65 TaxID=2819112 RepID=UPI001BEC8753|nr:matrixin family metalloprotease [Arthrobacter sp. ISL-65]MBT2547615.1 matrixin family metalloprotease [Arthrobacter sp. ISL-65]